MCMTCVTNAWRNAFVRRRAGAGRRLPDGVIDTVVTSPPYYRQRDYGAAAQLGHEATPEAYVARLVRIFAACRRALSDRGTLWIVLGDKYEEGRQLGMPWRVALALDRRRLDSAQRHHLAQAQRDALGRQDASHDRS